jgi:hypothetical protein
MKKIPRKNLAGLRFSRLIVVGFSHFDDRRKSYWACLCDCGASKTFRGDHLHSGGAQSCGCLQREVTTTHGLSKTYIYRAWNNMIMRCENLSLPNYGGRGITVCERWKNFENFYADMGSSPGRAYSLERRDNNGPYCPDNVEWATRTTQNRNKRNNSLITIGGRTQCASAWAIENGLEPYIVYSRMSKGWPVERLFEPLHYRRGPNAKSRQTTLDSSTSVLA